MAETGTTATIRPRTEEASTTDMVRVVRWRDRRLPPTVSLHIAERTLLEVQRSLAGAEDDGVLDPNALCTRSGRCSLAKSRAGGDVVC
jgi:hypothetical protein